MPQKPLRLLHEAFMDSCQRLPDKTAVVAEGSPYSYRQLFEQARAVACNLRRMGLMRGDRVCLYLNNGWPCAVSIFGVLLAGGVFVVVNPQTKDEKLAYIIDDCQAAALIAESGLAAQFLGGLSERQSLRGCITVGHLPGPVPSLGYDVRTFEQIIRDMVELAPTKVMPLDLAALIYTSGSTGNPKGVMMTHHAMMFASDSLMQYLRLSGNDRILNVLPLAFDYGLYQYLMSVRLGATLVLERSFAYTAQMYNRMHEQQVTVFPGVPTIYATIVTQHARSPLRFPAVTRITNTAAALPSDYNPILRQVFPHALIFRMYGLTECKRVCYLDPELADVKPTSVGKAIPGTEVFLLSPEGTPVPPGTPGILHVRGEHIMAGYWNLPRETARMLKDGPVPGERMLCAQDWFRMDEDGDLYFLGRSDDIIKTRGEKVSPVEVENVLYGISGVTEAAVIGVPDAILGEAIHAFVALADGSKLTERELRAVCAAKLEGFMVPAVITLMPQLPKTLNGKIRKKDLRPPVAESAPVHAETAQTSNT